MPMLRCFIPMLRLQVIGNIFMLVLGRDRQKEANIGVMYAFDTK